MLTGRQRQRLKELLTDGPHESLKWNVLLFSGGGNDLSRTSPESVLCIDAAIRQV